METTKKALTILFNYFGDSSIYMDIKESGASKFYSDNSDKDPINLPADFSKLYISTGIAPKNSRVVHNSSLTSCFGKITGDIYRRGVSLIKTTDFNVEVNKIDEGKYILTKVKKEG